jgi:short-subunit dehydrogenase
LVLPVVSIFMEEDEEVLKQQGIALITGASSGIGAEFARRLAGAAAGVEQYNHLPVFDELWLVARRGDRLGALAEELQSQYGTKEDGKKLLIRTVALDLVSPGAFKTLVARVQETKKFVSVLINDAGYGTYGPFSAVDLDRQLGQIDLNCRALTESCGRFSSLLIPGSLVINVASLAGFAPLGNFAVYAATKAYVLSFTVALATEWKSRGIRVHALCPGSVDSEFAKVASNGVREKVAGGYSAVKTTKRCLRAACNGKIISVPRFSWKIQRFAGSIVGPVISAWFANKFIIRPYGE